jgi:hypothetical protein
MWASRFGVLRTPRVGLFAPSLASCRAPLVRRIPQVVPLLSLSLSRLRRDKITYNGRFRSEYSLNLFEILKNPCYLCACVPKISLNQLEIQQKSVLSVCLRPKNQLKSV